MNFHPLVQEWFDSRFQGPSYPQQQGWPPIQAGEDVLIAAPTGSGKTLAAFLSAIDSLLRLALEGDLPASTRVVYVSPLKALANDVATNLLDPLKQIGKLASSKGLEVEDIRVAVRTGDTSSSRRRKILDNPPHILVTTPESLFILLSSDRGRGLLSDVESVIVDEIHSVARDKRGSHLTLTLEFLEHLAGRSIQRIGLSATQRPIATIARFLSGKRPTTVVESGQRGRMDLSIRLPAGGLSAVTSHQVWDELYDQLARLVEANRTTLVFVNTRRLAERLARQLSDRLGPESVAAHHGSLAREIRFDAETRLKSGQLRVVIATASLELGIDIGSVDLVCQIGSTRSIALAVQRIGRSGHFLGGTPRGILFPLTRDDLVECAALVRSIHAGELDRIRIPRAPLDVLAQHLVAAAAADGWQEEDLFQLVRRAFPYHRLEKEAFESILSMLSQGISTRKGRVGALLHRDRVHGRVEGRRGARLQAITSGGTIPENANYLVKVDPEDAIVGDLDEDFAVESSRGDIFLLGNTSWKIRRVESGVVRVEDAHGAPPTVPFWRGEAPGRTDELSQALSNLRRDVVERASGSSPDWLARDCGLDEDGVGQLVEYLRAGATALGAIPCRERIVAERFFDESGGMQLVLHAPFGSRVNRAWGLALRKRFCRSFNFELQAAATDDGVVISLSDQHSFPLDSVFSFLSADTVRSVLIQALLAVPLFGTRWRWTATRALQVRRFSGGKKVPPPLQRLRSDDLLAAVFPEQAACLEHIHGDIELPLHPLVEETVADCLTDAMDIEGLEGILQEIQDGKIECVSIDTREPSPLSHAILNANPYAFLDEAPLEERRTRAVMTRRSLLPEDAGDLAALDQKAIDTVREESWPLMRDVSEVHDALLTLGVAPVDDFRRLTDEVEQLEKDRRLVRLQCPGVELLVASERLGLVLNAFPDLAPPDIWHHVDVQRAQWERDADVEREGAIRELVRSRMECSGPVRAQDLSRTLGLPQPAIDAALLQLEAQGQILRGRFTPSADSLEWCDRTLLARIHRLTLGRLRREIEPASCADFMRFLFKWQKVAPGTSLHGKDGVNAVLEQLQGFEGPVSGWERFLLPARIADYSPDFLDQLCLSGQFTWGRLVRSAPTGARNRARPTRLAPLGFFRRQHLTRFLNLNSQRSHPSPPEGLSHPAGEILEQLEKWGASFFNDLVGLTGRLPVEVESGLWELVVAGLVTADGFAPLRALIDPRQRHSGNRFAARKRLRQRNLSSGRWSRFQQPLPGLATPAAANATPDVEWFAWLLLRRWGVVFRDLLKRESLSPPWRDLARAFRRLEAQGRVRGGRFVSGVAGEQFAAPEAVDALRTVRRNSAGEEWVRLSAADPLNLVGIVIPGPRIRPHPETMIHFHNGIPTEGEGVPVSPRIRESS